MLSKNVAASAAAALLVVSCVTAPYTGRGQLMLVSESNEIESGEEAYRHIMRDSVLTDNSDALHMVRKVGERIARAANKPEYRWEFRVINNSEDINAFCVPGGKVAVYTGIFPIARDEAGLAVILGHEVAHALLRHSGERMTQTQILGTGFSLAGAGGVNPQILQALGLGASVVEQQNGERAVAEALAYKLRLNLLTIVNERQQLKVGYGQYAALRGLTYLGRGSIRNIVAEYQRGRSWSTIAQDNASGLNELTAWITDLRRTTSAVGRQLRTQPYRSSPRMP